MKTSNRAARVAHAAAFTPQRKAIGYAYASSPAADFYGCKNGCWYVKTSVKREDGSWSPEKGLHNGEGFSRPDHADLIALYVQTDGVMCPYFKSHGNALALVAIATAEAAK